MYVYYTVIIFMLVHDFALSIIPNNLCAMSLSVTYLFFFYEYFILKFLGQNNINDQLYKMMIDYFFKVELLIKIFPTDYGSLHGSISVLTFFTVCQINGRKMIQVSSTI